jgi:hypothetical protein
MSDLPPLNFGSAGDDTAADMHRHIAEAMAAHASRNPKKAASALHAAESAAKKANLPRQAAKIRKALTMLAQGQVPRLLTRAGFLENER